MIRLRAKGKTDPPESRKNHRSRGNAGSFLRKKEFVLYDEFGLPKKVSVVGGSMFTFLFLGFL